MGRSKMSDSLILTFQTQLSGVMETILRSAICEITRLVEGSFLEEIGRGKQEAEVLRRRLQTLETKLGVCEKGSVTPGQEAALTIPDPELMTQVDGAIVGGVVKEEGAEIYPTAHCPTTADHRVSQSHNAGELSGVHTTQPEHWLPQRDKLPSTSTGNQDSVKQRAQSKNPDSKMENQVPTSHLHSELTGPAPSSMSPTVNQQVGTPESMAIKHEVVVVLPPEWEELDRPRTGNTSTASRVSQVREELQHRDPLPTGTSEERQMVYTGPCGKESLLSHVRQQVMILVKKQPKPAENSNVLVSSSPTVNISRGHSLDKSPSLLKPTQTQLQRSNVDERPFNALQTGRNRTRGHAGHRLVRTPHICSQCGKGFSYLCHLRVHEQIHTGERQFCCTLCGRSFTKVSNLNSHRRVHTGERPYSCMVCGARFSQKCNLKRHQRLHATLL